MIKGFIFDLDGVITDTANYHYLAWKRLADELGVHFDRDKNEALRGVSRRQSLLILLNGKPASEDEVIEWMDRKNCYYQESLILVTEHDLLPGVEQLLLDLHAAGILVGLASASKNAREVVDRLQISQYFDAISDGFSVDNPKPAPDLFIHSAKSLGLNPEDCVVVEDAEAGIEAGIAAGMRTIGIGPETRVGDADMVLPDGFINHRLVDILHFLSNS